MAADLHIHVLEMPCTEADLKIFFSNSLGHKYFAGFGRGPSTNRWMESTEIVGSTPNVHVGEVSWLKAALTDDTATYVPAPVMSIQDILEEMPVIDDELIARVQDALQYPNGSEYGAAGQAQQYAICDFLRTHKGKQAFTVSW